MARSAGERERWWSKQGPEGPWDAIVIGSGMGGMTAAAMLAKLGRRVLVLEQHFVPGGFTHTFRRGPYSWDVGVHAVGEVTVDTPAGRLLDDLTEGQLEWSPLGSVYDRFSFPDDIELSFPDDVEAFRDVLLRVEPSQRRAIDTYLSRSCRDGDAMRTFFRARLVPRPLGDLVESLAARRARHAIGQTTAEVLRSMSSSERLRAVLTAQWGYYGATPSRSSWAMHALVVKHFLRGAWYPAGGAAEIARCLLGPVARSGGWTRISTAVREILVADGRTVGVELEDGEQIRAPRIVSAVGVGATVRRLLPDALRHSAWAREVASLSPGPAHASLYVGLRGDIRSAGATAANEWFYSTWDMETSAWRIDAPDRLPDPPVLYCSFPSLKNPRHEPGPDQHHTAEVVTFVPWRAFERWRDTRWMRRGAEYDELKARLSERLLSKFLDRMPRLRKHIDHVELSTPLSTDFFTRAVGGSIYGLEPTRERFRCRWLRPHSPIRGLYLAGNEVGTVGVVGAMNGGMLAAAAADPRRALPYLRRLGM